MRAEVPNLLALFHSIFCIPALPCTVLPSCGGSYALSVGKSAAGWKLKMIGEYQINVKAKQIMWGQQCWSASPSAEFIYCLYFSWSCHRLCCLPQQPALLSRDFAGKLKPTELWSKADLMPDVLSSLSSGDLCTGDFLWGCFLLRPTSLDISVKCILHTHRCNLFLHLYSICLQQILKTLPGPPHLYALNLALSCFMERLL